MVTRKEDCCCCGRLWLVSSLSACSDLYHPSRVAWPMPVNAEEVTWVQQSRVHTATWIPTTRFLVWPSHYQTSPRQEREYSVSEPTIGSVVTSSMAAIGKLVCVLSPMHVSRPRTPPRDGVIEALARWYILHLLGSMVAAPQRLHLFYYNVQAILVATYQEYHPASTWKNTIPTSWS